MHDLPAPLDLLAFGPHPDDIEIGLGATIAKQVDQGWRVALCDLTQGELGSNGTPEERLAEADRAREVLGVLWRRNLRWPDGAIGRDEQHLREAVEFIRRWRPRTIALPHREDRHPDHTAASDLMTIAAHRCGLRRYEAEGEPWRPDWLVYYFINDASPPSFIVDVSAHYDRKRQALACHSTQFQPSAADAVDTRLTAPSFLQLVESRDAHFGALAGVAFAEGFVVREPVIRPHLIKDHDRDAGRAGKEGRS
jgi:N-acetylglucosamine malate deacetylase 1